MAATLRQPSSSQIRRISSQDFASLIDSNRTTRMTAGVSLDKLGAAAPGTPSSDKSAPEAASPADRPSSGDRRPYRSSSASISSPDLAGAARPKKPPAPPRDGEPRDSFIHVDMHAGSDRSTFSGSSGPTEGRARSTSTSAKVRWSLLLGRAWPLSRHILIMWAS
jgi:hypothetical protein